MSTSIQIRDAADTDCDAIAKLLAELYEEEGYIVSTTGDELARIMFAGASAVSLRALVAEDQWKQVVGAALYYSGYDTMTACEGYHLADIVVEKEVRRQKIGTRLFSRLATECLHEHKKWISLTVLRENEAAQAFYKALGLTSVDVDFFAMGQSALTKFTDWHIDQLNPGATPE